MTIHPASNVGGYILCTGWWTKWKGAMVSKCTTSLVCRTNRLATLCLGCISPLLFHILYSKSHFILKGRWSAGEGGGLKGLVGARGDFKSLHTQQMGAHKRQTRLNEGEGEEGRG